MATLADSLVSSSARRLSVRVRPDLTAERHRYQGRVYWVIKEPVSLTYFRFQEEEYAILRMLDGRTSLDELKDRFEAEFPPQKIGVEELQQFIVTLHQRGLVLTDAPGQGRQLRKRRGERKWEEFLGKVTNILSLRFRGIDPERLLTWLNGKLWWMFTAPAVACTIILAISALTLVAVQFAEFQAKLPSFHQFFSLHNAVWIAITLGITKVIHEFGHGLTCKHFGGECHEMGVMLLVMTPCLYCNVSDSWMLPNKWQRAMIGAAGMYVEVIIASICTFIWWFSAPGLVNQLALSTMFVCSVSTIVFNGNPLLRYDGYYILSDVLEIPNLRQKASEILNRKLGEWCLGLKPPDNPFLPERKQALFAIYSIAAVVYSWIVLFSILWFLQRIAEPYGLQSIGRTVAVFAMWGMFGAPLLKLFKYFKVPGRMEQVKKVRLFATLAVVSGVVAAFFLVPLPNRVFCTLQIEPYKAESIRVIVPGSVVEVLVKPGDHVEKDAVLMRLSNLDIDRAIVELEGKAASYDVQIKTLRQMSSADRQTQVIAGAQEGLKAIQQELEEKKRDRDRLNITAPVAGVVLPPPGIPRRPEQDGQLSGLWGSPLDPRNDHAYLPESTLVCMIGDPRAMQANLVVDQAHLDFVAEGQEAIITLDHLPLDTFRGKIQEIAKSEMKAAPRNLGTKAKGELLTKTDETGVERPWNPSYPALVFPLEGPDDLLRNGLRGRAKINARWQTASEQVWRFLSETFHFKM